MLAMTDTTHGHKIYRNDRSTRIGGGVLCLVSNEWPSFMVPLPDTFRNLDVIAVTIMTDTGNIRYIRGRPNFGFGFGFGAECG